MDKQLLKIVYDEADRPVLIDLNEIIKSRALFQANSGGGKSYIVRKFLEESHGLVQQIIIDPEGEYSTLREKYEYLLVAKGPEANIQINTSHAELLAKRLMETNANAIIDLYELNPSERIRFVKIFVEALVNLPKSLWHPAIIVIDEIHTYAPESSKGRSESLEAVASLASRGRKRGYALVGATQKLSKFHKDVAAELNTKFTGRCVLDIDQKRAAQELGFKDHTKLRDLKHEFYAFGPAIQSKGTVLVQAYKVKTTHEDIGSAKVVKVASKDKINKLMTQFQDLPLEAKNELKTMDDLKRKINELNMELRKTKNQTADPEAIEKAYQKGYEQGKTRGVQESQKITRDNLNAFYKYSDFISKKLDRIQNICHEDIPVKPPMIQKIDVTKIKVPDLIFKSTDFKPIDKSIEKINMKPILTENSDLSGPETKILTAILQSPNHTASKKRIALYCGYAVKGGAYANILGRLRSAGYIEYTAEGLTATEKGIATIPSYEPLPSEPQEIINFWTNKLGQSKGKVLAAIFEENPISREALAEKTQYAASGGAFANILGALRTLGLIDYLPDKQVGISKELMPEMLV